jgi:hypothetical protein
MQGYKVKEKTAIVPHCTPSFKTQWAPCLSILNTKAGPKDIHFWQVRIVIKWYMDLKLSMLSMPITTNVVSSNLAQARCIRFNIM